MAKVSDGAREVSKKSRQREMSETLTRSGDQPPALHGELRQVRQSRAPNSDEVDPPLALRLKLEASVNWGRA